MAIRIRQDATKSLPPSNQSTGEFFRAGSVNRLCQKRAAAAMYIDRKSVV